MARARAQVTLVESRAPVEGDGRRALVGVLKRCAGAWLAYTLIQGAVLSARAAFLDVPGHDTRLVA